VPSLQSTEFPAQKGGVADSLLQNNQFKLAQHKVFEERKRQQERERGEESRGPDIRTNSPNTMAKARG
jgi:hypothetical protein